MRKLLLTLALVTITAHIHAAVICTPVRGSLYPVSHEAKQIAKLLKVKTCGRKNEAVPGKFQTYLLATGKKMQITPLTSELVKKIVASRVKAMKEQYGK